MATGLTLRDGAELNEDGEDEAAEALEEVEPELVTAEGVVAVGALVWVTPKPEVEPGMV